MRSAAKYIWWILVIAFVGVFIFAETSGLAGRNVTRGTTIGEVNGEAITVDMFDRTVRSLSEQAQRQGQSISLDQQRQIEDQAFNQLVTDALLRQELDRRGIEVTDQEIQQAALTQPPPELINSPELQTEGRFDPQKYERFLRSPAAKQQGLLAYLEGYYRSEIPKVKLAQQLVTGVYVSDAQLWNMWQDQHDSASVSYVALTPETIPDSAVQVSDAELRAYFRAHEKEIGDRPGRAVVSVAMLARPITAADSAAVRQRILQLRDEIEKGAKFEDVAKRESADSASAEQGGSLGRVTRGRFVKEFEDAAFALKPGELSQPVLSPFGYHLIKVDERQGDTISVRHILLRVTQSDSSASATDRRADELAKLAAESQDPKKFDAAAKELNLPVGHIVVFEGDAAAWNGKYVPDVSAWAFGGAKPGETSSLIQADDAYYLARLDSLQPGGKPTFESVRDEVRRAVVREKKIDMLVPRAQKVSQAVAAGSTLEQAAQANGLTVAQTPMFTRVSAVPGLGRLNEAIGAAFALPAGAVSTPIKTRGGVFVIRVDRRLPADRAAWEAQKDRQREQVIAQLRQERLQQFMINLRESAKVEDDRKKLREARTAATT
ncbi:MAG TPA: peptidyl-prolyl cis-trans isomerase [Gemmatimonadaceae bacterium]|nr:peptidyl-prolyl cis-trans isomerase [Gemmatimonadaceae bacterium]